MSQVDIIISFLGIKGVFVKHSSPDEIIEEIK